MPDFGMATCMCGNEKQYDQCCGALHSGMRYATTAEELMRSRYSAHATHNKRYLLDTWHPETRPATVDFTPGLVWRYLEITDTTGGQPLDSTGTVAFIAHYRIGNEPGTRSENSQFRRLDGRWVYVDADG